MYDLSGVPTCTREFLGVYAFVFTGVCPEPTRIRMRTYPAFSMGLSSDGL